MEDLKFEIPKNWTPKDDSIMSKEDSDIKISDNVSRSSICNNTPSKITKSQKPASSIKYLGN